MNSRVRNRVSAQANDSADEVSSMAMMEALAKADPATWPSNVPATLAITAT
jgi:hypothetical protein